MTDRLRFPDDPIRVDGTGGPMTTGSYPIASGDPAARNYEYDDDPDGRSCQSCGGDGFNLCEDQDSSEGCWERDCNGKTHTCFNCHGSGAAKDQWFW